MYRLAVVNSHPIQYFAPLYRRVEREEDIDLTVYYCSRRGVDSYSDEGFGEEVEWDIPLLDGYEARFLPNIWNDNRVGDFIRPFNPAVVPEMIQHKYDALWLHGHNNATYLLAMAAAKLVGTAVLMRGETHLLLDRPAWKRSLRSPVMSAFYRLCDGLLAIGSRNREFYQAHGVPEARIFNVPYTVDNQFFWRASESGRQHPREVRSQLGLPCEKPLILFASKFIDRKRPLDLLKAFERLRAGGVEAGLVFVGSGPLKDRLRSYVRRHDVPDVFFLGFRNQSELPKIYGCCDLFVLPSENEPWGLIINEVMAAGLPVITTHEVGAAADLVREGENGLRYETGDLEALAEAVRTLLTEPGRRKRMGRRSRQIIEEWSYDECVEGLRSALSTVVSEQ